MDVSMIVFVGGADVVVDGTVLVLCVTALLDDFDLNSTEGPCGVLTPQQSNPFPLPGIAVGYWGKLPQPNVSEY